jgi:hypothetical protein
VTTTLREGTSTITITDNVPAGMSISVGQRGVDRVADLGLAAVGGIVGHVLSDVNVVDGLNDRAVFSFGTATPTRPTTSPTRWIRS